MLSRRAADCLTARVYDSSTRRGGCRLDAYREGNTYYVDIDLPGVDPATIDVAADRAALTVRAERKHRTARTENEKGAAVAEGAAREGSTLDASADRDADLGNTGQGGASHRDAGHAGAVIDGAAVDGAAIDGAAIDGAPHEGAPHEGAPRAGLHLVAVDAAESPITRQVALSGSLDTDRLDASYDDGVLTLRIPLAAQGEPREVAITADLANAA
jgi:HSP20 family protein